MLGGRVISAWIYGSVARGEDHATSDLDIAFIASEEHVGGVHNEGVDLLVVQGEKLNYAPSLNTLSPSDLQRLRDSDDPLWQAFVNEGLMIMGRRPETIV